MNRSSFSRGRETDNQKDQLLETRPTSQILGIRHVSSEKCKQKSVLREIGGLPMRLSPQPVEESHIYGERPKLFCTANFSSSTLSDILVL